MAKQNPNRLNLVGQRYGRWIVLAEAPAHGYNRFWLCRCDCGTEKEVQQGGLRNGATTSCGCLSSEQTAKRFTKHGHSPSRKNGGTSGEYNSYYMMIQRCTNPRSQGYFRYGGRGISVCQRWLDSFPDFLADMGLQPTSEHSLDRYPDRHGHYEPGNVRWATQSEQANNRDCCRFVTIEGRTQTLTEWARELNRDPENVRSRVAAGWDEIEALMTPLATTKGGWGLRRQRHGQSGSN